MTVGCPSRRCAGCGEWLPHACAAEVTITRERWTGRRVVTIRDRQPPDRQRYSVAAERQGTSHQLQEQALYQPAELAELEAG